MEAVFPGQSLRWAWYLIMISASCHVVGSVLTQILARDSYINPLYDINPSRVRSAYPALSTMGSFIGGPLQMLTLAGGLFLALRLCRKLGIGRQRTIDWVILAIVLAYTFRVLYVVIRMEIGANRPTHLVDLITWGNDPLLCVLLFFAFFLRRSVAEMGWGYVTKCWTAYVVAILGTSVASMAIWAADFDIFPYPERAVIWYIWPIIFAAYALGPHIKWKQSVSPRRDWKTLIPIRGIQIQERNSNPVRFLFAACSCNRTRTWPTGKLRSG